MEDEAFTFTGDLIEDCGDNDDFPGRILEILENLYTSNRIYSNIGKLIVAINPLKQITELYTRELFDEYKILSDDLLRNPPSSRLHTHIWTVTRDAILQTLTGSSILQTIAISGESGAGKTEAAKRCLQYLASFQRESSSLEGRIISSSTLIESFGNATTSISSNSTRHGKWLELFYEINASMQHVELTHARLSTFLLEMSRVVASQRGNGERNYHIFYQLCASGCMGLEAADSYRYLLPSSATHLISEKVSVNNVSGIDDRINFLKTEDAMDSLLYSDEEKEAIFSALKCILLLGNVEFCTQHLGGSDGLEAATVSDDSLLLLEEVSDRLGLDVEVLAMSFLVCETTSRAGVVETSVTTAGASNARDALCKEIYSRLFNSIARKANSVLVESSSLQELHAVEEGRSCIGLLDMFGFENLATNSLEQLCINYSNEKLLSHFLINSILREQDLYLREGVIPNPNTNLADNNKSVLLFFEMPTIGFFARLGDEYDQSAAIEESFLDHIESDFIASAPTANACCYLRNTSMPKFTFEIRHFVTTVRYNACGFVKKNKYCPSNHFEDLFVSSSNIAFRRMMIGQQSSSKLVGESESKVATDERPLLSTIYPSQLTGLIKRIESSEMYLVQCIKPNSLQQPGVIEKDVVLTQLMCSGIMDAFQIRKNGFPLRFSHKEFSNSYRAILSRKASDISDLERCELICERFQSFFSSSSRIVVGKSMVLAQHKAIQQLDEEKQTIVLEAIILLQRFVRMKRTQMNYHRVKRAQNKLNNLMKSLKSSADVDSLVDLESNVNELERIIQNTKLPLTNIPVLNSAKKMIERLYRIQNLHGKIQLLLRNLSDDSYIANGTQETTAADSEYAQQLLSEAAELECPSGSDLIAQLIIANERLQQKTNIIHQLQLGVKDASESILEKAVQCIELLSDSDGISYSEEESLLAQNFLSQLRSERAVICQIWKNIVALQDKRAVLQETYFNDTTTKSHDYDELDRASALSLHREEMMQALDEALLTLRTEGESSSLSIFASHVSEIFETLIRINQTWIDKEWISLGIEIKEMNGSRDVLRSMQSDSNLEEIKLIDTGIVTELNWMTENINNDFVSVYLESAHSDSLDHFSDELLLVAEKLREFSFCGECNTYMLNRIEFFLQAIELLQDEHFEEVLYVTEADPERYAARVEEHCKLKESIAVDLRVPEEEVFSSLNMLQDSEKHHAIAAKKQSSDTKPTLPLKFHDFDQLLDDRLMNMRSSAFQSFIIAVLRLVQPIRSVLKDIDEEDAGFDVSIESFQFVLDYISSTFPRPTELVIEIVKRATQLKDMRKYIIESNYTAIVENYSFTEMVLPDHLDVHSAQSLLGELQKEIWIIIWHAIRRHVEPTLVAHIENSLISGPFGSPSLDKEYLTSVGNQVEKLVAYCDGFTSLSEMELTDDVTALIHYSKSLIAVKMSYLLNDKIDEEGLEETLQSLTTLKELFLLLPDHLTQSRFEDEISRLHEEIEYKKIMNTLREAISFQDGVVAYLTLSNEETVPIIRARTVSNETPFVPLSRESFRESRSRSVLCSSADDINQQPQGRRKRADTQFTPRLNIPPNNLTLTPPTNLAIDPDVTGSISMDSQDALSIIDEVLSKDRMRLNNEVLEVQSLDDALEAAEDFLSTSTYADDLPPQYYTFINSIELLRNLRLSVKRYQWKEAYEFLNKLKTEELLSQVPDFRDEALAAAKVVNEFYLISNLMELLQKCASVGVQYGEVDYSSINLDALAEIETLCNSIECHSDRSVTVRRALLLLVDLRRAQKNNDWVAVTTILKVITQENLDKKIEFSNLFQLEVNRAAIERDNHENINVMKAAIAEEEIPSSNGLIQLQKISTEKLSGAHVKAYMVPADNRGFVFKSLFTMVEVLLKIRKNLMQKKWSEMITLLPFLQESNDSFLNMLENLDKSVNSPMKSRGSTLMKGSVSSSSPKPQRYSRLQSVRYSTIGTSIETSSMKIPSVFWDTYMSISQLIQKDINTIQTHTSVSELEDQLNSALQGNFVRISHDGSIDRSKVSVVDLEKALDLKTKLESTDKLTLSYSVVQLSKSAQLAFEIRKAVLEDDWQKLNSLIEGTIDGEFGFMQDCTRREIQVVRAELQNRWIISNLQDSLKIGRAKGNLQKVDLTDVSCDHFESYISTVKSLNPTTEEALKLLLSVERMSDLRKLICSLISVNWNEVRTTASAILDDVNRGAVSEILREELELIKAASDDTLKCDFLMVALKKGGPNGSPGAIDLSTVDTTNLGSAYDAAAIETVKTDTLTNLMNACKVLQYLRNALLKTSSLKDDTLASVTWHSVSLYIGMIDEYRSTHPEDESFQYCDKEITLIRQHAALKNIHSALISSVIIASHVYSERNAAATDSSNDANLRPLSIDDLETIISSCQTLGFQNDISVQLKGCAAALKELRSMVNSGSWTALNNSGVGNAVIIKALKVVPQAERELEWIVCETNNHFVIEKVTEALKSISCPDYTDDHGPIQDVNESMFSGENRSLEMTLSQVANFKVTSTTAQQLMDSFSHLLRLRRALETQNSSEIVTMLWWFRENAHMCTFLIHAEAQRCYVIYQNAQLVQHLRTTLQSGKPAGQCGDLRTQSIDVENLQRLLNQCKVIKPLTTSASQMKEAATVVLSIRKALKASDYVTLQQCIEEVFTTSSSNSSFHSLIVDEVAIARSELDNETVVQALHGALYSYDLNSYFLDGSFVTEAEQVSVGIIHLSNSGNSFAETKSVDQIGVLSSDSNSGDFEIDLLDAALDVSSKYGILSERAKRLHHTAVLVRACRRAYRRSDWVALEALLFKSAFHQGVHHGEYDSVAEKEIFLIESHVKLRSAIIDLTNSLKVGWASCANGIVDTTTLETDLLSDALNRVDQCLRDMCAFTPGAALSSFDTESSLFSQEANKQLTELLRSGNEILRIRSCLKRGHMYEAIQLTNLALSSRAADEPEQSAAASLMMTELLLYSKDIIAAMSVINTFDMIVDNGLKSGDIGKLNALISGVKMSQPTFLNDLGLIRILFHAEEVHAKLKDLQTSLPSFEALNDKEQLFKILSTATSILPPNSPPITVLESRIAQLDEFDNLIRDISSEKFSYYCDRGALKHVVSYAGSKGLLDHPHTMRARKILSLSKNNFFKSAIAHAVTENNSLAAAVFTIQMKLSYLSMKSSALKYQFKNFPLLRAPIEYGVRMNVISLDLQQNMLFHTHQSLPTSLTKLSPQLSALAVWVFTHCISAIERNMYSHSDIQLIKLIRLGCSCVPLRDEIYIQLIKQTRYHSTTAANTKSIAVANSTSTTTTSATATATTTTTSNSNTTSWDENSSKLIWTTMCMCLQSFPPSKIFEPYMETYFLSKVRELKSPISNYAKYCLIFLHQTVFKYGYKSPVQCAELSSIIYSVSKFITDRSVLEHFRSVRSPAAKKVEHNTSTGIRSINNKSSNSNTKVHSNETASSFVLRHLDGVFDSKISPSEAGNEQTDSDEPAYGTRGDWESRFRQFSSSQLRLTARDQFVACVSGFILSTTTSRDRDILNFIVCGRRSVALSEVKSSLRRECMGSRELFHYVDRKEEAVSKGRQRWLERHIRIAAPTAEGYHIELDRWMVTYLACVLWDEVLSKIPQNITAGYDLDLPLSGMLIAKEAPVGFPSVRKDSQASRPSTLLASSATKSFSENDNAEKELCSLVSTEVDMMFYHDLIIAGMRIYCSHG